MGRKLNPAKTPGRIATVTLNAVTLMTEWGPRSIEVGKRFKVNRKATEEVYYFIASKIEPTAPDSNCAWVTGKRVNARGDVRKDMMTHLHCPEGERMELIYVGMVG